jgi:hypothetical protein
MKWLGEAGPNLAAAKLKVRLLVFLYQAANGVCQLLLLFLLWACGQRACVVRMSTARRRRAFAPDGHWSVITERLVKAALVAEGDPFADADPGLAPVGVALDKTSSCFSERQSRSMNTLSIHRPRPSIEMRTPAPINTSVKAVLVNWLPWSVLKIPGLPERTNASCNASMQNEASRVFESRQDNTARLAQSITATR